MNNIKLNNNTFIPVLGLGTYKITDNKEIDLSLNTALDAGYRHFDTASVYGNELLIGKTLKDSVIDRQELFLTSKVWNSDQGFKTTIKAFENSLRNLQTDYLDLYLIHWPVKEKYTETWKALEKLYSEEKVKAIGVSNFQIHHLKDIFQICNIKPAINQIELHPYFQQNELREFCKNNYIQIESWSPIARGKVLNDKAILEIAGKYKKTPSQIVIRWHIDNQIVTIPKSSNPKRIIENYNIFDFSLSNEDLYNILDINKNIRTGPNPDNFVF